MDSELVRRDEDGFSVDKDTLYLLGGAALIVFGAGLVLSNPVVRKYMAQLGIGNLAKDLMPDIDRYIKLRSM
jgi:hypothetical protein